MDIGKVIAARRKEQNISQEKQAEKECCHEKAEMSQGYISSIERGKEKPSLELLEKIAKALGCELFIDLIPIGSQPSIYEPPVCEHEILAPEEPEHRAPTWVTLENARALTIFGIAYQKLEMEKDSLSDSERKALEGIIETCKALL